MRCSATRCLVRMITAMGSFAIAFLFWASGAHAQFLNGPESVTYDALNGRYLISNVLSGDIVQITDEGDTAFFDRTLERTLGMTIVDNILYVADISGLVTFDLTTDQKITTIRISGMYELNDVAADSAGYLYITDSSAGKIFRMRISDHSYTTIVSGITIPNGILFDAEHNRVLFCQFVANAPIKAIDPDDLSVTTVLTSGFMNFDGLAIDGDGYIYVSCWGNYAVYRYDNEFNLPAELISSGHNGPADIFYNQADDILAIPNYYSNSVDFVPVQPAGVDDVHGPMPEAISLSQNYPNPFNMSTMIEFDVRGNSTTKQQVTLAIYDVHGRLVRILISSGFEPGHYTVAWNGRDESGVPAAAGVYFYTLNAGVEKHTRTLTVLN
jgi:sugar lactone lactonase YvrE